MDYNYLLILFNYNEAKAQDAVINLKERELREIIEVQKGKANKSAAQLGRSSDKSLIKKVDEAIGNTLISSGNYDLFEGWEKLKGNVEAVWENISDSIQDKKEEAIEMKNNLENSINNTKIVLQEQKRTFDQINYNLAVQEYERQKGLQDDILTKLKASDELVKNESRVFYSYSFWPSVDFVSKLIAIASKDPEAIAQGIQMLGTLDFTNMLTSLDEIVSRYVELWKIMQENDKIRADWVSAGRKASAAKRKMEKYEEK